MSVSLPTKVDDKKSASPGCKQDVRRWRMKRACLRNPLNSLVILPSANLINKSEGVHVCRFHSALLLIHTVRQILARIIVLWEGSRCVVLSLDVYFICSKMLLVVPGWGDYTPPPSSLHLPTHSVHGVSLWHVVYPPTFTLFLT